MITEAFPAHCCIPPTPPTQPMDLSPFTEYEKPRTPPAPVVAPPIEQVAPPSPTTLLNYQIRNEITRAKLNRARHVEADGGRFANAD